MNQDQRVAYLEARVGELNNTIGELRAESANRLEVGDRLGWRLVEAEQEIGRLRREVEFEANGADTFAGADARAERGEVGAPFIAEDFGLDVDTDAGGIYISLNHRPVARTEEWGGDVNVDYDEDGTPTGVEILRSPRSVHPDRGGNDER